MSLPPAILAELAKSTVCVSRLVFMDFVDAPRRWWVGFGALETGGHTWQGTGAMIAIDGIGAGIGTSADSVTFTLSGVDPEIVALAAQARARVKDRRVVVYEQFFDNDTWQPIDEPQVEYVGKMDRMRFLGEGPGSASVVVTAESLWTGRNRSPFSLLTDRDQNARFPGDRGLERVAELVNKSIIWK